MPEHVLGRRVAVQASQTFGPDERAACVRNRVLRSVRRLKPKLFKAAKDAGSWSMVVGFFERLPRGAVIGVVRFHGNVTREEACLVDEGYTDFPKARHHRRVGMTHCDGGAAAHGPPLARARGAVPARPRAVPWPTGPVPTFDDRRRGGGARSAALCPRGDAHAAEGDEEGAPRAPPTRGRQVCRPHCVMRLSLFVRVRCTTTTTAMSEQADLCGRARQHLTVACQCRDRPRVAGPLQHYLHLRAAQRLVTTHCVRASQGSSKWEKRDTDISFLTRVCSVVETAVKELRATPGGWCALLLVGWTRSVGPQTRLRAAVDGREAVLKYHAAHGGDLPCLTVPVEVGLPRYLVTVGPPRDPAVWLQQCHDDDLRKWMSAHVQDAAQLACFAPELVVGQDGPLHALARAVVGALKYTTDDIRPNGVFVLLHGKRSVGKRTAAMAVAQACHGAVKLVSCRPAVVEFETAVTTAIAVAPSVLVVPRMDRRLGVTKRTSQLRATPGGRPL